MVSGQQDGLLQCHTQGAAVRQTGERKEKGQAQMFSLSVLSIDPRSRRFMQNIDPLVQLCYAQRTLYLPSCSRRLKLFGNEQTEWIKAPGARLAAEGIQAGYFSLQPRGNQGPSHLCSIYSRHHEGVKRALT